MPGIEHSEHFSVKIAYILSSIILFQSLALCQVYPDKTIDSTLKAGINQIILQNYPVAEKTFTKLDKEYPRLPLGKIYLAAVNIARSYDMGERFNEPNIDSLLYLAEDQSRNLLDQNANSIWARYFLSLSEGYLAYFKALNEAWFSSISEGIDALNDFEEILKADKIFYEAYIAIGTYKYWKSRKTEFLDWMPGYQDEQKEGIELLEKAVNHPGYNTYLAVNSLIWIYIDQQNFKDAAVLAESALKTYPGSRFFKWGLARAYESIDAAKSIKIYKEILNSLPVGSNHYNEIILKHLIAQQYASIGDKREALKYCDEILSIKNLDEYVYSKVESRLERVEELRRELNK